MSEPTDLIARLRAPIGDVDNADLRIARLVIRNMDALMRAAADLLASVTAERDARGIEAFTLRNERDDARRSAANWLKLHNQQEERAEIAEDRANAAESELTRLREALAREREECAKVAEDLATKRAAHESGLGFTPGRSTIHANRYWCEDIAAAIRSRNTIAKPEEQR